MTEQCKSDESYYWVISEVIKMKYDRILIDKDQIPYRFSIALNLTTFQIEVRYNEHCDLFVIGLYDKDKNLICYEPIIYGAQLFKQHYQAGTYPAMRIVPFDESGENTVVTWDNFNKAVFLMIDNVE